MRVTTWRERRRLKVRDTISKSYAHTRWEINGLYSAGTIHITQTVKRNPRNIILWHTPDLNVKTMLSICNHTCSTIAGSMQCRILSEIIDGFYYQAFIRRTAYFECIIGMHYSVGLTLQCYDHTFRPYIY